MNRPLSYSCSQFDTAPISFLNAYSLLFRRDEIKRDFVIGVYCILLSPHYEKRKMEYLASWINDREEGDLKASYLSSYSVFLGPGCTLYRALSNGGKGVAKIFGRDGERYIAITEITNDYLYFFDPLFDSELEEGVERVEDKGETCNGRIKMSLLSEVGMRHMEGKDKERKELLILERIRQ